MVINGTFANVPPLPDRCLVGGEEEEEEEEALLPSGKRSVRRGGNQGDSELPMGNLCCHFQIARVSTHAHIHGTLEGRLFSSRHLSSDSSSRNGGFLLRVSETRRDLSPFSFVDRGREAAFFHFPFSEIFFFVFFSCRATETIR